MKRLMTKWMNKWLRKNKLSTETLLKAIKNLEDGKSSIDLGSGLYKVRVASENAGKSSGYRSLIVYKANDRAIVIYAFSKAKQDNLTSTELKDLKGLSKTYLALTDKQLEDFIRQNKFLEIGD